MHTRLLEKPWQIDGETVETRQILFSGCDSAGTAERSYPRSRDRDGGWEELPHVRGQGQKPGGPHAQGAAAKRSYPKSEVRGSSQECQAATAQEQQRGAIPRPRPGAADGRSHPTPEARGGGREEQPHIQGAVAAWAQEGLEELSHVEDQEGWQ